MGNGEDLGGLGGYALSEMWGQQQGLDGWGLFWRGRGAPATGQNAAWVLKQGQGWTHSNSIGQLLLFPSVQGNDPVPRHTSVHTPDPL